MWNGFAQNVRMSFEGGKGRRAFFRQRTMYYLSLKGEKNFFLETAKDNILRVERICANVRMGFEGGKERRASFRRRPRWNNK